MFDTVSGWRRRFEFSRFGIERPDDGSSASPSTPVPPLSRERNG
jgi:hypothetical protein